MPSFIGFNISLFRLLDCSLGVSSGGQDVAFRPVSSGQPPAHDHHQQPNHIPTSDAHLTTRCSHSSIDRVLIATPFPGISQTLKSQKPRLAYLMRGKKNRNCYPHVNSSIHLSVLELTRISKHFETRETPLPLLQG